MLSKKFKILFVKIFNFYVNLVCLLLELSIYRRNDACFFAYCLFKKYNDEINLLLGQETSITKKKLSVVLKYMYVYLRFSLLIYR